MFSINNKGALVLLTHKKNARLNKQYGSINQANYQTIKFINCSTEYKMNNKRERKNQLSPVISDFVHII